MTCIIQVNIKRAILLGKNAGAKPSEERDGHGPAFGTDVTGPQRLTDCVITFEADGQNGQH